MANIKKFLNLLTLKNHNKVDATHLITFTNFIIIPAKQALKLFNIDRGIKIVLGPELEKKSQSIRVVNYRKNGGTRHQKKSRFPDFIYKTYIFCASI